MCLFEIGDAFKDSSRISKSSTPYDTPYFEQRLKISREVVFFSAG